MSFSRRQFLRANSGFTLGLPFLPSLAPRAARAAGVDVKRFVAITTEHGAVAGSNMCPADGMLTSSRELYTGHTIRWGNLVASGADNEARVCPVVRAPKAELTDRLLGKLNILRGFDVHFDTSHQQGCHLGNFSANLGGYKGAPRPTIDHVMAWSNSVYPNLTGVKMRGVVTGQDNKMTFGWSNPPAKSGTVQSISNIPSNKELFSKLIGVPATPSGVGPRKPLIDRVLANYRSLRESNRRLSASDRQRVDDHMARLAEIERRMTVTTSPRMACQQAGPATDSGSLLNRNPRDIDGVKYFGLMNDIIAMAFACDTTRVVVMPVIATMVAYSGDWHQNIAHMARNPDPQRILAEGLANTFRFVFLDLARKLDGIEQSPGVSLLDTTWMQWTQEAGPETHWTSDLTHLTFGSAGGAIKTGVYVDYRNRTSNLRFKGLAHRQFLGNALASMGVPKAEYDPRNEGGYGDPKTDRTVAPQMLQMAGSPLPVIAV
jgi:hypothetical protein